MEHRPKFPYLPQATNDSFMISTSEGPVCTSEPLESPLSPETEEPLGQFPCPCCGCLTFPVPREEAMAHICPVCFWENDGFDPEEDAPSDENRGMTLRQGRENYRRWGAVRQDLVPFARPPRPEELP